MSSPLIPKYNDFHWPSLLSLRALGGSASIEEMNKAVIERMNLTDEQQAVLHGDGPNTEISYRVAWARTYLKGMGLADNSERGVWSLTPIGLTATEDEIPKLRRAYLDALKRNRTRNQETDDEIQADDEASWQDQLLDLLMGISPDAFERLSQRLLREAGFINTDVLGRSGDGGIDGVGVYRLSLLSFPVYFQCKRYKGSVDPHAVRDFRGAMAGRGDKGLLITTGTFTAAAKEEASRDGAPPIDLIDGERLCLLLKEYKMGVKVTAKIIEDVEVVPSFFSA